MGSKLSLLYGVLVVMIALLVFSFPIAPHTGAQITVPIQLSISPPSFTISSGKSSTFTATLSYENPLAKKTISWNVTAGSLSVMSGTTNSHGQVSVTYTAPTVDVQTLVTITASFLGDAYYSSGSVSSSGMITATGLLQLEPVSDAHIDRNNPDSKYGKAATLSWQYTGGHPPDRYRSYLKFDISSIPRSCAIISAKLYLYTACAGDSFDVLSVFHDDWTENEITWNNAPPFIATIVSGSGGSIVSGTWISNDVTNFVRRECDIGDSLVSFGIKVIGYDGTLTQANSREATTNHPYLEVSIEPKSAKFEFSDLVVTPTKIELEENVTISFMIRNVGEPGKTDFVLNIGGPVKGCALSLHSNAIWSRLSGKSYNGGSNITVEGFMLPSTFMGEEVYLFKWDTPYFILTPDQVGNYTVELEGLRGNFTVTVSKAPSPPPKPAEFEVSDLTIAPAKVEPGKEVEISLLVKNIGEQQGSHMLSVLIENGQIFSWVSWIDLDGGTNETVRYRFTPEAEGIYKVEVNELIGSFTVKEPPTPASFEVYDLQVHPREPSGGEIPENLSMYPARIEVEGEDDVWTFRVSVNVTNNGELEGTHTVELKINGSIVDSKTLTLEGGEDTRILFEVERGIGTYQVDVDGRKNSFEVVLIHKPSFWDKISGFPYESIILGLIAAIIIIWRVLPVPGQGSKVPTMWREK